MLWLVAGLILAGVMMVALQWWSRADVGQAKQALFWVVIGAALMIGGILLATGKGFASIVPIGYAAFSMFQKHKASAQNNGEGGNARRKNPNQRTMTREQALEILGLEDGATDDEITAAHRRMIAKAHPDMGGSDWMAAQVNAARERLLGD